MAKRIKTKFVGVRYREHATRKHGIMRDRYFTIRYKIDGKDKEEGLGWSSQGITAQIANARLSEIKENQRLGKGDQSLKEKRNRLVEKRKIEQAEQEQQKKENILFNDYFEKTYLPVARATKKKRTLKSEMSHYKNWIEPAFGGKAFNNILPLDCERIKKNLLDAGRAPRTLQYIFAIVRQTWSMACRDDIISTGCPTRYVKIPRINNERLRFLSHSEADLLLKELARRSRQLHDMALMSLHCGLRAGEFFSLEWSDIDLENGILNLRDAKSGSRPAYLTEAIKAMLASKKQFSKNKLVFPDRNGKKMERISNAFSRAINELGFNTGIIDKRQKVVFHSLRHTFASWHAQNGTDLYTLQKLLGHKSFDMVQRYAHLSSGVLQEAVKNLEKTMAAKNNVIDLESSTKG